MVTHDWREAVEEKRDALEAIADSGADLELVNNIQTMLYQYDPERYSKYGNQDGGIKW